MKPRILFILHLPPPVHGAAMVGKYIHDSQLINEAFDCRYINLAMAASLEDIGRVGVKKVVTYVRLLRTIQREVKAFRPGLVYVTPSARGGAFYKDFPIVQMLKGMGCRVVVHFHNKGVSTRQDRFLDNWLYRRFFHGLKVILLGESLYGDVAKYVRRADVYICPNGIPVTSSSRYEAPANRVPRLLFLSNMLESKGVLVLLDALVLMKERGYSFVCDFVGGETAEIDVLRFEAEVERRGLNEQAIYLGRKYGEEKEREIAESDVFVLPTRNDCFPLVLLEAMMHGKPVVSTAVGAIPDIVEDKETGLIDHTCERDSLAQCIETLLANGQLRLEYGENGRRKYQAQFTDDRFEHALHNILENLVGG